jgi:transcriptional regulator with XRE-family HTH domain
LECFRSIRRLSRVEEQLKQKRDETIVEAQAIVGVDQVAGLKRLIDSLESQLSYYHRLISDLEGNVSDLRSQDMELERRVREREKVRGVARERSGQRAKVMSNGARRYSGTRMDVIRGRRFGFTQMTVGRPENGYHDARPETIRKIAQAVGVKLRELLQTKLQGDRD